MVNINIELPEELHKKLKLSAIKSGVTMKQYVTSRLEQKASKLASRHRHGGDAQ